MVEGHNGYGNMELRINGLFNDEVNVQADGYVVLKRGAVMELIADLMLIYHDLDPSS